jgi:hypothetical protein
MHTQLNYIIAQQRSSELRQSAAQARVARRIGGQPGSRVPSQRKLRLGRVDPRPAPAGPCDA